ncbi:MAG: hypothetical protein ACYCU7_11705 [Acidimicrobiales bacterium]
MVTELVTGLGMLGYRSVDEGLAARPAAMADVAPGTWDQLESLRAGGFYDPEFEAAFANGAAFLSSPDALRERVPRVVEWKGSQRAPGDEVAPIDLRVDHVYLVSCKYLSRIVYNVSPAHLFDDLLVGRHGRRRADGLDWYQQVAPAAHRALYEAVRHAVGPDLAPAEGAALDAGGRRRLAAELRAGWPGDAGQRYGELADAVAGASAARWRAGLATLEERQAMLWRLLRMGSAPYFVLGAAADHLLRLRIATPWDWRHRYRLVDLAIAPQPGGQPRVGWAAEVRDRDTGEPVEVAGHVEVRWSHGRFGGPPEAKVYLDTPHDRVPGYFALDHSPEAIPSRFRPPPGRRPAGGPKQPPDLRLFDPAVGRRPSSKDPLGPGRPDGG